MSDVAEEYKSSLAELNFNSKPHINMLTMIAEENIKHAPAIVQTIVDHINSVSPEMMLPCMYLIDSIIKNIGKVFVQLFSKHLVSLFTSVFEKVDENVRSLLYKLRSTWTGIFPNALMLRLDRSVQLLDPAWPILAQAPPKTTIHVNPKFLDKSSAQVSKKGEDPSSPQSALLHEANELKKKQIEVLKVLEAKKQQLLELQKKASVAVAASEVCGADVQKVLNARDPRLSRKETGKEGSTLHSVVVVPKGSQASQEVDDSPAGSRASSPEPKRIKLDASELAPKADLRNKLRDIKNSSATAEFNLKRDKPGPDFNHTKRKKPVNNNNVPSSKMSNKIKNPVSESDHMALKQNILNKELSHKKDPAAVFIPNRDVPELSPVNAKPKEDLYENSNLKQGRPPALFGNEDRDYRPLVPPKLNADERHPPNDISYSKRLPAPVVKSFKLDNKERKVYFVDNRAFAVMDDNLPHELRFEGPPKSIFVEGLPQPFELGFQGDQLELELEGRRNTIKFGTPAREVYINGYPYEAQFGGQPLTATLEDGKPHRIHISGPPPQVILDDVPAFELYTRFCQTNKDFLRNFEHQPPEMNSDLQQASMDVDMRVTTNSRVSTTVFNFPLEKVNDVDWKRMSTAESSHITWTAPQNAFETFKMENPNFITHRNFPERPAEWDRGMPMLDGQNQSQLVPPLLPPAPLLNRFSIPDHSLFGNKSFSSSESSLPQNSNLSFQRPDYPNPQHQQFIKNQSANPPRLPPPPLPPFLASIASSTTMTSPFVNTVVSAPKPMAPLAPPPMPAPSLMAPICAVSLSNPLPLPPVQPVPVPATSVKPPLLPTPTVPPSQPEPPVTSAAPISNIDRFLKNLVAAGIISGHKKSGTETPPESEKQVEKKVEEPEFVKQEPIPAISFSPKSLKQYHRGVISALHVGSQCAICGMRFKEMQSEQYGRHLDWHFRMNRREKDGAKKPISRRLFFEIADWIDFKEIEEVDERAPSYFELQGSGEISDEEPETVCSVPSTECESEICAVCEEKFQLFWVEDEEEWHLRNAVKHEDQVYHPACYEDFKKAQEAEAKAKIEAEARAKAEAEEKAKAEAEEKAKAEAEEKAKAEAEAAVKAEEVKKEEAEAEEANEKKEEEDNLESSEETKEKKVEITKIKEEPMDVEEPPTEEKAPSPKVEPKIEKKLYKEEDVPMDSDEEGSTEFRPPTPDPRFQNLPPVMKGTELSALCSIM